MKTTIKHKNPGQPANTSRTYVQNLAKVSATRTMDGCESVTIAFRGHGTVEEDVKMSKIQAQRLMQSILGALCGLSETVARHEQKSKAITEDITYGVEGLEL